MAGAVSLDELNEARRARGQRPFGESRPGYLSPLEDDVDEDSDDEDEDVDDDDEGQDDEDDDEAPRSSGRGRAVAASAGGAIATTASSTKSLFQGKGGTLPGVLLGIFVGYPVAMNLARGGPKGLVSWLGAKFVNKPAPATVTPASAVT